MPGTVALLFAASLAGGDFSQACVVTPKEAVLVHATQARIAAPATVPKLKQVERYPRASCGVWRIRVAPDGTVRALDLVRSGGEAALVKQMEAWLRKNRYKSARRRWFGLVVVQLPTGKAL